MRNTVINIMTVYNFLCNMWLQFENVKIPYVAFIIKHFQSDIS